MSSLSCALYRIHSTTLVPALLRSSSIPRPRLCSLGSITKGACSLEKFNSTSKFWGFGFSTRIVGSFVAPRSMGSVTGRQSAVFAKPRVVVKKVLSKEQPEGDGATVRRSIGRWVSALDVMLNLNEFWNNLMFVYLRFFFVRATPMVVGKWFSQSSSAFEFFWDKTAFSSHT